MGDLGKGESTAYLNVALHTFTPKTANPNILFPYKPFAYGAFEDNRMPFSQDDYNKLSPRGAWLNNIVPCVHGSLDVQGDVVMYSGFLACSEVSLPYVIVLLSLVFRLFSALLHRSVLTCHWQRSC